MDNNTKSNLIKEVRRFSLQDAERFYSECDQLRSAGWFCIKNDQRPPGGCAVYLKSDSGFLGLQAWADWHPDVFELHPGNPIVVVCRPEDAGRIIGKGGARIKFLREATGLGCRIEVRGAKVGEGYDIHIEHDNSFTKDGRLPEDRVRIRLVISKPYICPHDGCKQQWPGGTVLDEFITFKELIDKGLLWDRFEGGRRTSKKDVHDSLVSGRGHRKLRAIVESALKMTQQIAGRPGYMPEGIGRNAEKIRDNYAKNCGMLGSMLLIQARQ